MPEIDLLWTVVIGTLIFVFFAVLFISIIIANQKRVITAQKERLAESRRLADVLRQVPNQIIGAQEEERARVAKELHDGINQMLASIKYRLHALNVQHVPKQETENSWMEEVSHDLDKTMEEVRRISRGLLPKIFVDYGFPAAVRGLCDEYLERSNFSIQCELTDLPTHLSRGTELSIYRILQEALHNIEKHAGATSVAVQASHDDSGWRIKVSDNGKGFDAQQLFRSENGHRGIGLTTMKERAILIGGILEVHSSPGNGTEVILKIPSEASPS